MKNAVLSLAYLFFVAGAALAQPVELKSGKVGSYQVRAGSSERAIDFWLKSPGKITNTLQVALSGPAGLKGQLQAKAYTTTPAAALATESNWYTLETNVKFVVPAPGSSSSGSSNNTSSGTGSVPGQQQSTNTASCPWLTEELYTRLRDAYQARDGVAYTRDQVCARLTPGASQDDTTTTSTNNNPTTTQEETSDQPSVQVASFLRKNTCDAKIKGYVVRLRVLLDGVDASTLAAGFTVQAKIAEVIFTGNKASSLKPKSDGRFFPNPLFLISSTGYSVYGDKENVSLYRWVKGAPRYLLSLPIYSYMYYRNLRLARIVATKAMRGGKATLEITGGTYIYSGCYELSRRRQSLYGYPK